MAEIKEIKVGTKVKIIDCSEYTDHKDHENQVGIVVGSYGAGSPALKVEWLDGVTSAVKHNNVIITDGEWDL